VASLFNFFEVFNELIEDMLSSNFKSSFLSCLGPSALFYKLLIVGSLDTSLDNSSELLSAISLNIFLGLTNFIFYPAVSRFFLIALLSFAKLTEFFNFLPEIIESYWLSIFSISCLLLWMLDMPKVWTRSRDALIYFTDLDEV
jgi:hypothetical protein